MQHYVMLEQSYWTVFCGHCMYPRLRKRVANARACEHYEARSQEEAPS